MLFTCCDSRRISGFMTRNSVPAVFSFQTAPSGSPLILRAYPSWITLVCPMKFCLYWFLSFRYTICLLKTAHLVQASQFISAANPPSLVRSDFNTSKKDRPQLFRGLAQKAGLRSKPCSTCFNVSAYRQTVFPQFTLQNPQLLWHEYFSVPGSEGKGCPHELWKIYSAGGETTEVTSLNSAISLLENGFSRYHFELKNKRLTGTMK